MRAERTNHKALLMLAGTATILLGCVAVGVPDTVPTLSVKEFSKAPESYRGAVLRICGDRLANIGVDEPSWILFTPKAFGYHPAMVKVLACRGRRPIADVETCIVGRVLGEDGSLEPLAPDEILVKDPGDSSPWTLHAQCSLDK
jgi:hypothetical protein